MICDAKLKPLQENLKNTDAELPKIQMRMSLQNKAVNDLVKG